MNLRLKNGQEVSVRLLQQTDCDNLCNYLESLSPESRSRFGPHAFDRTTVEAICNKLPGDTHRYVAIEHTNRNIVAYMLLHKGMIEWDALRYASREHRFDAHTCVTFAPSVADKWQSSGLGSAMTEYLEQCMKAAGIHLIVLWGGVQASNEKAVNFYRKHGYQYMASFYHDGKDNYDMIKVL
jgi:diamine N-acetyltransferase